MIIRVQTRVIVETIINCYDDPRFQRSFSLSSSNFHGLVVGIPPSISSVSEKNILPLPSGGFSLFCCHILENECLII